MWFLQVSMHLKWCIIKYAYHSVELSLNVVFFYLYKVKTTFCLHLYHLSTLQAISLHSLQVKSIYRCWGKMIKDLLTCFPERWKKILHICSFESWDATSTFVCCFILWLHQTELWSSSGMCAQSFCIYLIGGVVPHKSAGWDYREVSPWILSSPTWRPSGGWSRKSWFSSCSSFTCKLFEGNKTFVMRRSHSAFNVWSLVVWRKSLLHRVLMGSYRCLNFEWSLESAWFLCKVLDIQPANFVIKCNPTFD